MEDQRPFAILIHNQNAYQRLLHLLQKAYMAMAKKKGTTKIDLST